MVRRRKRKTSSTKSTRARYKILNIVHNISFGQIVLFPFDEQCVDSALVGIVYLIMRFFLPFIIIHYDTGILIISQEQNGGRIEDQFVNRFVRDRLKSMPCQNQGFILDGYPKSTDQAKEVFACKSSFFQVN